MPTVLLTGGRAPVTLDLARKFAERDWRVLVAESIPTHLCKDSLAVAKSYHVKSPRFDAQGFIMDLLNIIETEHVSLLIPTCEEIFTVAQSYAALALACNVFAEPLARLLPLHSKFHFIELARSFGLSVPQTDRICNLQAAQAYLGQSIVMKPEYSRFATATIMNPQHPSDLKMLNPSPERSWVVQKYIEGRQICTYSIAHHGNISAHCAYATEFTAGQGSTIVFRSISHPKAEAWVRRFIAQYAFTGQIAFDFIENDAGEIFAIECNPRAISGVHLFDPNLIDAFCNQVDKVIRPTQQESVAVRLALLLYGWRSAPSIGAWLKCLAASRDVIYDRVDWKPFFAQFLMFIYMLILSLRTGLTLIEATTYDIEWNDAYEHGERLRE